MSVKDEIISRLGGAFSSAELEVINDSHQHRGHAGDDGSGESHFTIRIRSPELAGMARIARHRAINRALGDLTTRIHAIRIDAG